MAAMEETSAASTPAPPLAEQDSGLWGSLRVKTVQDKLRNLVSKEKVTNEPTGL